MRVQYVAKKGRFMAGIHGFVMRILCKKTVQLKTRQQIHQGPLFLMDLAFGLKLIYSAKKTHHDMQGIFESDCESNQKISLYY